MAKAHKSKSRRLKKPVSVPELIELLYEEIGTGRVIECAVKGLEVLDQDERSEVQNIVYRHWQNLEKIVNGLCAAHREKVTS